MLQRVERRTFRREHRTSIALEPHQRAASVHAVAVAGQKLDLHLRVERAEECCGDFQAGNDDRLAAGHFRSEVRVGGDRRCGSDVSARAQILGKHSADEVVKVELRVVEGHAAALSERPQRR
jgi:hypothetical protein